MNKIVKLVKVVALVFVIGNLVVAAISSILIQWFGYIPSTKVLAETSYNASVIVWMAVLYFVATNWHGKE